MAALQQKLQKEMRSKKVCSPQEGHCEKRCKFQGGSQKMAVNSKNFTSDNSGELDDKS